MCGKCCTRQQTANKTSGYKLPIQCFGPSESQFASAWAAHPSMQRPASTLYYHFDILKANYLLPPPNLLLSSTDLIAQRVITLQKCQEDLSQLRVRIHKQRNKAMLRFKKEHQATIHDFDFKAGVLILIQNIAIEKSLNCKMWPHYLGPLIIVL